jgi:bacteriocin biosynthesis cyclodehydratase domain-containing protein
MKTMGVEHLPERPKLRRDSIFLQTHDGIYFRTRSSTFTLKGKAIYGTFVSLVPYLNGTSSWRSLVETLEGKQRALLLQLLATLLQRGVIYDWDPENAIQLDQGVAACFAAQFEFLEHWGEHPRAKFMRFRYSRFLLLGHGAPFLASGSALLRNGLHRLWVMGEETGDLGLLHAQCEELERQGVESRVAVCRADQLASLDTFDLVIFCSDRPSYREVHTLNERCKSSGARFLPACVFNGSTIVGPYVSAEVPGCWLCVALRWSDNAPQNEACRFWKSLTVEVAMPVGDAALSSPMAQMLGNSVAFEAFKLATGVPEPEARTHILVQDTFTLESSIHPVLPHPACTLCHRPAPTASIEKQFVREEQLSKWSKLMDERFGIFQQFDDGEIEQLPLRLSCICFHSPLHGSEDGALRVYGWSDATTIDARWHALAEAVKTYSYFSVMHLPTFSTKSLLQKPDKELVSWKQLPEVHLSDPLPDQWLKAESLASRAEVFVPAVAVCHSPKNGLAGWGVGLTLETAALDGIWSASAELAIRELIKGELLLRLWIPPDDGLPAKTEYLLSTIRRLQLPLTVLAAHFNGLIVVIATVKTSNQIGIEDFATVARMRFVDAVDTALAELIACEQMRQAGYTRLKHLPHYVSFTGLSITMEDWAPAEVDFASPSVSDHELLARCSTESSYEWLYVDITPVDILSTNTFNVCKILARCKIGSSCG